MGIVLCFFLGLPFAIGELKPETKTAYQKYIADFETKLQAQDSSKDTFLWIDRSPGRMQSVKRGDIVTEKVNSFEVPGGMIQHWIGGVFLPGVTLAQLRQIDQDYPDYSKIYAPDITQSRILLHDGDHFVVSYRITKKKVLTAVVDTVHEINYRTLASDKQTIWSRSDSVRQVDDAGTPSERVLPEGEGTGFLWAMNSYWRMQQRDGGVYMECEAITLSRSVPFGMGHLINPILESFAEESLTKTMQAKKRAVESLR